MPFGTELNLAQGRMLSALLYTETKKIHETLSKRRIGHEDRCPDDARQEKTFTKNA